MPSRDRTAGEGILLELENDECHNFWRCVVVARTRQRNPPKLIRATVSAGTRSFIPALTDIHRQVRHWSASNLPMPTEGLEPSRPNGHSILSAACLPIPPRGQTAAGQG